VTWLGHRPHVLCRVNGENNEKRYDDEILQKASETLAHMLRIVRGQRTPLQRQRSILAILDEGFVRPPHWRRC
jgi:hypothetical protein